jgi:hypothetical protein
MHLIWAQYFQILSLLLSITYSKGLSKFKISGFIPLLLLVCITEFIGSNRAYFGWKNNYFLYDCYLIISFPVTFYIFYKMLLYVNILRIIYFCFGGLVLMFFIFNLFYIQGSDHFDTYTLILSEFVITLLSLLVLIKLFKDDDFDMMLYEHPYFWLSGATLIFSVSTLVILGLQQYIETEKIQIDGKNIYRILTPIMNVILYVSYCYAFFLCSKQNSKLSRQSLL